MIRLSLFLSKIVFLTAHLYHSQELYYNYSENYLARLYKIFETMSDDA